MRKAIFSGLIFFALLGAGLVTTLFFYRELGRRALEWTLNRNAQSLSIQSIQVGKFYFDRNLRIHIEGLRGKFQSESGLVPLEIHSIQSQGRITDFFSPAGLALKFDGVRPENSKRQGIGGVAHLRGGRDWVLDIQAEIHELGLEEIQWINPENLSGATGEMKGETSFRIDAKGKISSNARFEIAEPGGRLQARFFDLLTPYIPQLVTKEKVEEIRSKGGLVGFREASLKMETVGPDKMKVFLHIAVPDYNLILNLNIEVHLK